MTSLNNVQSGQIDAIAVQYGVPTSIWQDVAQVESGNNAQAVGDNGTSFGLFQLHIGGQLPAQYTSNPTAVFDPVLNAQIAMPSIARAWNNLKTSFDPQSSLWWQQFASQSGHPGGSPGQQVTDNEAARLQQSFSGTIPPSGIGPIVQNATNVATTDVTGQAVQNAILGPIEQFALPALERIGIFLFALILVILGFMAIKS